MKIITQFRFVIQVVQTTHELCYSFSKLYINDIRQWMKSNSLKLNDDKTKFMFCFFLSKINIEYNHIGYSSIALASKLGIYGTLP